MREDERMLYLQVAEQIKANIEGMHYKEGDMLPSEFELSRQLNITRSVLREALHILEADGVVVTRPGVGTFVHTKPLFTTGIEEIESVTDMIKKAKMTPETIYLSSSVQPINDDDQRLFNRDYIQEIMEIERVRTADGVPVVYCLDRLPYNLVKGYSIHGISSIFDFLEEIGSPVQYAITHLEPISYHEHISEVLECGPETALLLLKQMHYDSQDEPLFYSLNYFRADKFNFHVVRKRV